MDMEQVWEAFDQWERTQVCIRGHVRVVREEIERELDAMRETITRQHSLLWMVGLDIHEGEERASEEVAVRNLQELLRNT